MKIKTSALTGAALDWAVAKCEGIHITFADGTGPAPQRMLSGQWEAYSTNWAQAGPIIEREMIQINPSISSSAWGACNPSRGQCVWIWADTPLIAAMRCYVAAKLGDEVVVPDALVGHHHAQPVGLATLHMRDTQIAQLTVALANAREQAALWRKRAHQSRCF